jgi:hypothetical protein
MGTGTDEAAIGESGEIEVNGQANGAVGAVGKALENLGFAGRGKDDLIGNPIQLLVLVVNLQSLLVKLFLKLTDNAVSPRVVPNDRGGIGD